MNTPKTYGTPRLGTYFFAADCDHDAMNVAIVELAESFGWEAPESAQATIDAVALDDDQRANGPNHATLDALETLAKDAVEWLNEQESREDHVWDTSMAGDFGLWHESDRPTLAFLSARECLDYIKANDANGYETLEGHETLEQLQEACRLIAANGK